jgi:hypothetical protein
LHEGEQVLTKNEARSNRITHVSGGNGDLIDEVRLMRQQLDKVITNTQTTARGA